MTSEEEGRILAETVAAINRGELPSTETISDFVDIFSKWTLFGWDPELADQLLPLLRLIADGASPAALRAVCRKRPLVCPRCGAAYWTWAGTATESWQWERKLSDAEWQVDGEAYKYRSNPPTTIIGCWEASCYQLNAEDNSLVFAALGIVLYALEADHGG